MKAEYTGKLTDGYIKLQKDGYFRMKETVLGLSKVADYRGRYDINASNNITFHFCGDSLPGNLSGKGYIDNEKKLVIVNEKDPQFNRIYFIEKDRREK